MPEKINTLKAREHIAFCEDNCLDPVCALMGKQIDQLPASERQFIESLPRSALVSAIAVFFEMTPGWASSATRKS